MIKRFGMFAAGVLFGTAGLKILGSKDARKVYAHTTAAVLRAFSLLAWSSRIFDKICLSTSRPILSAS